MGLLGSPVFLSPEVSITIAVLKSSLLLQMSLLVFITLTASVEMESSPNVIETHLKLHSRMIFQTADALKQTLFGEMLA